jgi:hypothetical protein
MLPPHPNWARNLLRLRLLFVLAMQLHVYDLETAIPDLQRLGFVCKRSHEPWDGFRSTQLYAKRSR